MNIRLVILLTIFTISCGVLGKQWKCTFGSTCTTTERGKEVRVGAQGLPGAPGSSCSANQLENGVLISCTDGTSAIIFNGVDGEDGAMGEPGKDGESCDIEQVSNGAIIRCGATQALILNGQDGTDGMDGQDGEDGQDGAPAPFSAYAFVDVLDPCGDSPGFDEVLFKTAGGNWIAHYSHGNKQFLTILEPGTYVTTDMNPCTFVLNTNGEITY